MKVLYNAIALIGVGSLLGAASLLPAGAQDQEKRQADPAVQKLIDDLANDSFDVRRAARDKLFALGQAAVPALTNSALDEKQQTGYSAVRILSRMASEGDAGAATAARGALEKIGKGDDAIARQARQSLEENQQQQNRPTPRGFPGFGGNQMQFQFGGNGLRSIQRSNVNGVETIRVKDGDEDIEITTSDEGIVVRVVEGAGANRKQKVYKAKDREALQKNHPDAYKLYRQYAGVNPIQRVPRIVVPRDFGELMAPPLNVQEFFAEPFPDPFARQRRGNAQLKDELDDAQMLLNDLDDLVKQMQKKRQDDTVKRVDAKLKALRRNLERIRQNAR